MIEFFVLWGLYEGIKALVSDTSNKIDSNSVTLSNVIDNNASAGNFKELVDLHNTSKLLADEAFRRKQELNEFIQQLIAVAKEKRNLSNSLYEKAQNLKGNERNETFNQIKKLNQEVKDHNIKIGQVKAEKDTFLEKVKNYNKQTGQLKYLIRDTCGRGGQAWFEKSESKRALKA